MTDNCDLCGNFVPDYDWREEVCNPYFCRKCNETILAEDKEIEIGIGNGQICYVDEDTCRHCFRKWSMTETVFNAVFSVVI